MSDMDDAERKQAEARRDAALDWLLRLEGGDAQTRQAFEAWCAESEANAAAFRRVQGIWTSALVEQAAQRLVAPRPKRRRAWVGLALSATLVLAVGVAIQADLLMRLRADHYTRVGERENLQLPGMRVLLNSGSAIEESPGEGSRRVARLLRGEAYFETERPGQAPIEVRAGEVQVRGTAFAVRYLDGKAEVSVRAGEADLNSPADFQHVMLAAGERARVGPAGVERTKPSAQFDRMAWIEGRLVFENCPFGEVLDELRRYYPGWIFTRDESLAARRVTGNYRLDDPVAILRALAQVTASRLHEYPSVMVFD